MFLIIKFEILEDLYIKTIWLFTLNFYAWWLMGAFCSSAIMW